MSDTQPAQNQFPDRIAEHSAAHPINKPLLALTLIGIGLILIGIFTAIMAGRAIQPDSDADSYRTVLGLDSTGNVATDTTWMWIGVGTAVFGAIILIARLIISAAKTKPTV